MRNPTSPIVAALIIAIFPAAAFTEPTVLKSASSRTSVLELFTSEGCSSCPPADEWMSRLIDDDRLWSEVVPIAFHVDYWDHLGWKDPVASRDFSSRQREHAASWKNNRVYTPGFVLNGLEWRGW